MKKISNEIHEEIINEIFRQILIKNDIADAYVTLFNDDYEYKEDELGPFGGMIYIFKDNDNIWNVWEDEPYEIFQGYIRGMHTNFKQFSNQEEAYIDAAKRMNINIPTDDLTYDVNDIKSLLEIIESATEYLKFGVDFFCLENKPSKLWYRYLLLKEFEKELIEKRDNSQKKMVKK